MMMEDLVPSPLLRVRFPKICTVPPLPPVASRSVAAKPSAPTASKFLRRVIVPVPRILISPPAPPNAGAVAVLNELEPLVTIRFRVISVPETETAPPCRPYLGSLGTPPLVSIALLTWTAPNLAAAP